MIATLNAHKKKIEVVNSVVLRIMTWVLEVALRLLSSPETLQVWVLLFQATSQTECKFIVGMGQTYTINVQCWAIIIVEHYWTVLISIEQ